MAQTPRPMLPYEDPLRSRFVGSCARRTSGVALRMSVEDEIQRLREEGKKEQAKDAEEEQLRVVLKQLWEGLEQREAVKAQVVARAEELLEKVQGSEKLKAIAGSDTGAPSVASILAKNPQVAQLEEEIAKIEQRLLSLSPLGLAQLGEPRDAALRVLRLPLLHAGDGPAAAVVEGADAEFRFLSDAELDLVEALVAGPEGNLKQKEGAALRRVAAAVMRDFHKSTAEAALQKVLEACPSLGEEGGALGSAEGRGAMEREVVRAVRVAHYAASAGYTTFTADPCVGALKEVYAAAGVEGEGMRVALEAVQQRLAFLAKCAKAGPESWVAVYAAMQHLRDRLAPPLPDAEP